MPLILCVAAAIACALAPFTPIVTGALFLYFCFVLTLSVIDFRTQLLPDKLTLPLLWLGLVFNAQYGLIDLHDAVYGAVAGYGVLWCVYWGVWLVCHKEDWATVISSCWPLQAVVWLANVANDTADCLAGWHWLRHRFTTSATPDYNHYRIRPVACARQHDKPGVSGLDLLLTGRVLLPTRLNLLRGSVLADNFAGPSSESDQVPFPASRYGLLHHAKFLSSYRG